MIFFNLNMFIIGVLYGFNWYYADKKNFIDENLDRKTINYNKKLNLAFPALALIAIALTFIYPSGSTLVYLAIFFIKRGV
jgi:uncharacterized membrane protein